MTRQKVLFVQEIAEKGLETESIWCIKTDDVFTIDNIPFIARRIALGDKIKVEYDISEKAYYFDDFIEVSGNSTIRIYFEDEGIIQEVRDQLNTKGCQSELFLERKIVAVNIPQTINYKPIKEYLGKGEQSRLWTYEESCLSHAY